MADCKALSVDVEDYFQVTAFESKVPRTDWEHLPSRVVENTRRLLRLFEQHGVKATFFVLGWVAERYPHLVKEIDGAGHEIASHSYWHRLIYELSPREFREDLVRAKNVLEQTIGKPVTAFRAPTFSITKRSMWALAILAEEGFTVDSSIFPIHHDRYGIPGSPSTIHEIETDSGTLMEFPMSAAQIGKVNVPASGGGYFRLYPYRFSRFLIKRIERQDRPFMFYLHPWEIDPQQPVIPDTSLKVRWRHYINLKSMESKLDQLLTDFSFLPVSQSLGAA